RTYMVGTARSETRSAWARVGRAAQRRMSRISGLRLLDASSRGQACFEDHARLTGWMIPPRGAPNPDGFCGLLRMNELNIGGGCPALRRGSRQSNPVASRLRGGAFQARAICKAHPWRWRSALHV